MATIPVNQDNLSDLVFHEIDPSVGYARRVINLSNNDTEIPMGTVVFRASTVDQAAPYAVATKGDLMDDTAPADDIDLAVVFGDAYGCKRVFTTADEGNTQAVAFVRGEVFLKDHLLLEALDIGRDDAEYGALKGLLEDQGIIIETTINA